MLKVLEGSDQGGAAGVVFRTRVEQRLARIWDTTTMAEPKSAVHRWIRVKVKDTLGPRGDSVMG